MAWIERIWDIQWFSWWESDDIYIWPKDSFFSWEWIEIRKNLSGVRLSSGLVNTWWSISGTICYMANLETLGIIWWWTVVCTESWNIYLDWVLKETISTWTAAFNKVIGIWVMTVSWSQYVYYISSCILWWAQIHRSNSDLSSFTISYKSFVTSYSIPNKSIIINSNWYLYIWYNNKILSLYSVWEILTDWLILPEKEIITWFTQFQNQYKIYSNLWNSWIQYLWDWSSIEPDYRQIWENQPVLWVVNDWPYDYAILWFNEHYSDLYLITWTQKQEIRVNLEASFSSRILQWNISIREWIVYISWGQSWESYNYWIYTYWNYYPGAPKSLVQEYSWWSLGVFGFHSHWVGISYFSCSDWNIYSIEHNNPPSINKYATTWYVVTHMYQWNIWEDKKINKIKVWFEVPTSSSIKIYLRSSFGWLWILAKTIDNATYWDKKWLIIFNSELSSLGIWNFNEIQMKIELNQWLTAFDFDTPTVFRITTFMEVVNNQ